MLDDYISRQAAIDALVKTAGIGNRALDKIRLLPPADVQPVVRCRDCKHLDEDSWCYVLESDMENDAFCSYGEKKEDKL